MYFFKYPTLIEIEYNEVEKWCNILGLFWIGCCFKWSIMLTDNLIHVHQIHVDGSVTAL